MKALFVCLLASLISISAFAVSMPGGFTAGEHVLVPTDNSGRYLPATIITYDESIGFYVVKYDDTFSYRMAHALGDISGDAFAPDQIKKIDSSNAE